MPRTADPDLRDQFETAMRRIACSVCVVTTDGEAGRQGVTIDAMTSVSADPPMLLVCVPHTQAAAKALLANGVFAVNVLAADQVATAASFSGQPLARGRLMRSIRASGRTPRMPRRA